MPKRYDNTLPTSLCGQHYTSKLEVPRNCRRCKVKTEGVMFPNLFTKARSWPLESPPVSPRMTRSKTMAGKVIEKAVKTVEEEQVSEVEEIDTEEVANKESSDCGRDTQEVHGETVSRASITSIAASDAGETEKQDGTSATDSLFLINEGEDYLDDIPNLGEREDSRPALSRAPSPTLSELLNIEFDNMLGNEFCKTPVPGFGVEDEIPYSDSDYLALSPNLLPATTLQWIDPMNLSSFQPTKTPKAQPKPPLLSTPTELEMEFYFSCTDCQRNPKPIDFCQDEEVAYADFFALDNLDHGLYPITDSRQWPLQYRSQIPRHKQRNARQSTQPPAVQRSPLSQVQNAGLQGRLLSDVNELVEKEVARRLAALQKDTTPPKTRKRKVVVVEEEDDEEDKEYAPRRSKRQRKASRWVSR
jgi:hypothetical protein